MNQKTIFITGATSGVGQIITKECIKKGYKVFATGRNLSSLNEIAELGATVFQAELKKSEDIDKVCSQLPPIDVAIFNAGVGSFQNALELLDEEIEQMINVNIMAPIYLTKRIGQKMVEKKQGHLIFIGSQAGKVATKKASVYAASKHAITGFTNGLRMELAPFHIMVTTVFPGPIDTPFLQKADETNHYRSSIERFLLNPEKVALRVMKAIEHPVREINMPRYMSLTSKLYAVAPVIVEKLGSAFFNKK